MTTATCKTPTPSSRVAGGIGALWIHRVLKERIAAGVTTLSRAHLQPLWACHYALQAADHRERHLQMRPCFGMRNAFSGEMLFITTSPPFLCGQQVLGTVIDSGLACNRASRCPHRRRAMRGMLQTQRALARICLYDSVQLYHLGVTMSRCKTGYFTNRNSRPS